MRSTLSLAVISLVFSFGVQAAPSQIMNCLPDDMTDGMKTALVSEAEASVKALLGRLKEANLNVEIQTVKTTFEGSSLMRIKKLYEALAASLEEYETAQRDFDTANLQIDVFRARVTQVEAALEAAEARLLLVLETVKDKPKPITP